MSGRVQGLVRDWARAPGGLPVAHTGSRLEPDVFRASRRGVVSCGAVMSRRFQRGLNHATADTARFIWRRLQFDPFQFTATLRACIQVDPRQLLEPLCHAWFGLDRSGPGLHQLPECDRWRSQCGARSD